MHLLEQYMIEERSLIMKQNMVVRVIGRREGISEGALREIDKTIELTRNNTGTCLCLAVNYRGAAPNSSMRYVPSLVKSNGANAMNQT